MEDVGVFCRTEYSRVVKSKVEYSRVNSTIWRYGVKQ
jgi:hypothetical protein